MGRRRGFLGILSAIARESAKQQRLAESAQRRQLRDIARAGREQERRNKILVKVEKERYIEQRIEEVDESNIELQERIDELKGILECSLLSDHIVNFDSLRINNNYESFKLPDYLRIPLPEPHLKNIKMPTGLMKLIPGSEKNINKKWKKQKKNLVKLKNFIKVS